MPPHSEAIAPPAPGPALHATQSLKPPVCPRPTGLYSVISDLASLDLSFLTAWRENGQHAHLPHVPAPEDVVETEHADHSGPSTAPKDPAHPQEASAKVPATREEAPKSSLAKSNSESSRSITEPVTCQVACLSWPGQKDGFKKSNQDSYCFMRTTDKRSLLFGVFDGHGPRGREASQLCKARIPELLQDKGEELRTNTPAVFAEAFIAVQREIVEQKPFDSSVSGTTAVMAHLHQRTLTVAWAGDSRAVLAKRTTPGEHKAVPLSDDHKPEKETEKERIEACNGSVYRDVNELGEDVGPYRVWMKQGPMLGLAMSRSIGDRLAHTIGVSEEAEVRTVELEPEDHFLILASDGVWEWISNEEAVEIVRSSPNSNAGAKKLMQQAKARWLAKDIGSYVDDITALVIFFTHVDE